MNLEDGGTEGGRDVRPRTLRDDLWRVGGLLQSKAVDRGDRAELRRLHPDAIPPEVFWRITEGLRGDDAFWLAVLPLMVDFPHEPGKRPGRVLVAGGVKPARILRWLRRDRASAWREASRMLGPARGVSLDWGQFGILLAKWDNPEVRREFARDYFSELHKRERRSTSSTGGV